MTDDKLDRCADSRLDPRDDEQRVFVVAHRHGIVQQPDEGHEYEAIFALYATRDGEKMVLEAIPAAQGEIERVPRVSVAADDALKQTNDDAKRFVPVVNRHPELDNE